MRELLHINSLRRDRGEGDPLLTLAAMVATLIIAGSLIGGISFAIQVGDKYVREQVSAITLSTARTAWQQDTNNASIVHMKDATEVSMYEVPGQLPGIYMPREGQPTNLTTCRKSTWTLKDGVFTNVVQKFTNANCDLDDADATATKLTTTELTGISDDAQIVAFNEAGRDLHFHNFQEVGLTSEDPDSQSTAERDPWFRDYEWEFSSPKTINLEADIDLAVSTKQGALIVGNTNLATTSAGATSDVDPDAQLQKYKPGPVDFKVARGTTGTKVAGARESLRVSITDIADCGPYNVTYKISVKPTTSGAAKRSASVTAFGKPAAVEITNVPNGSVGTVAMTASCPKIVQDGAASTKSKSYTQTLPKPSLSGRKTGSAHIHSVTWGKVSSLGITYRLEGKPGSQGWRKIGNYSPRTMNVNWGQGKIYGANVQYRVKASVGKLSSTSNTISLKTSWSTPGRPGVSINRSSATPGQSFRVTVGNSCPAGTSPHYRTTTSGSRSVWTSKSFYDRWNSTGTRYYYGSVTCSSTYGGTSPRSGSSSDSIYVYQPRPGAPGSVYGTFSKGYTGGGVARATFTRGSGATKYQYYFQGFLGGIGVKMPTYSTSSSGSANTSFCSRENLTSVSINVRAGNNAGWSGWKGSSLRSSGKAMSCF